MARRRSASDIASTPSGGGKALAFPGQGVDAQDLAAVLTGAGAHPLVSRLATILGTDDWAHLDLTDTRVAQPAVFTASCVSATDPTHADATRAPVAVFGHSLGELAACVLAGVMTEHAGLDLVDRRATLGHAAQQERPGRMIVVMRLSEPQVELARRLAVARSGRVLDTAVVNGTGQIVLSGDVEATDHAMEIVADLGGVARAMPIGGAYHSALMAGIVEPYRDAIAGAATADPAIPVVSCTTQQVCRSRDSVVDALAHAVVLPVRWPDTMTAVRALGVDLAIDVGPSRTLTNLARFSPVLEFRSLRPEPG